MGNPRCQWVRERLPLLAGEELRGLDLRRVERHLIGCPKCRHHRASMDRALNILHVASSHSAVPADAPSLWPNVARQIRQSRRPAQTPLFTWSRRLGLWPAFGLSLAVVASAVAIGSRGPSPRPRASVVVEMPIPTAPLVSSDAPTPPAEAPEPSREAVKSQAETASAESVPASRLGYDLDHAMPMGVEAREGKPQPTY
jgi:anti-sigma factor RsiW